MNYGVFPLRGKLLNVREASAEQLIKNAEIKFSVEGGIVNAVNDISFALILKVMNNKNV